MGFRATWDTGTYRAECPEGWSVKIHLNKCSIWMEGENACCSPGSVEENLSQVLDFIRVAEEWVAAVQEKQFARKQELVSKP